MKQKRTQTFVFSFALVISILPRVVCCPVDRTAEEFADCMEAALDPSVLVV